MKISQVFNSIKSILLKPFSSQRFFPINSGLNFEFGTDRRDLIEKGYGQNPYVFQVINRIVERAIHIDSDIVDENGEIIENLDPFFKAIFDNPNPEGWKETQYRMLTNFEANELFIVEVITLGFAKITGFIVPNSQDVIINLDSRSKVIISYDVTFFGHTKTFLPDQVLHIKRPNITSNLRNGISPLVPGRKVYESNNEVWNSEAALHKNKGINGVLFSDGSRPLEAKEQKELQEQYDKRSIGKNFGKVQISTAKLGYIRMGVNPSDLQSLDTKLEHLRTICTLYNADPKLFGDAQSSTYNNMAEAKLGLIVDAILPMLEYVMPQVVEWVAGKLSIDNYFYHVDINKIPEFQVKKDLLSQRLGREVIQGILPAKEATKILYPELAAIEETDPSGNAIDPNTDTLESNLAAEEANAQAQAGLRGSVGGVQGILAIQQSVAQGTTSEDAAIAIFISIYGFTEEDAMAFLKSMKNGTTN